MRWIAAIALMFVAAEATAQTVTRTYTVQSLFSTGSYPVITTSFTASFDPTAGAMNVPLTITSDGPAAAFGQPVEFDVSADGGGTYTFSFGGVPNDTLSANDFFGVFTVDSSGEVVPSGGSNALVYFLSGVDYVADSQIVSSVDAAPEPASWLMMIGGVAFAGGMVRSRQRRARRLAAA